MSEGGAKRKNDARDKRQPKKFQHDRFNELTPGAVGIIVTCVRGKERAAEKDALDMMLESDYIKALQAAQPDFENADLSDEEEAEPDIEASIAQELDSLKEARGPQKRDKTRLLQPLKTDLECVVFIKTARQINPTSLVADLCKAQLAQPGKKLGGRFVRRLTPISASADASMTGLKACLERILPAEFSCRDPNPAGVDAASGEQTETPAVARDAILKRSFRIEPTFRNHNVLTRNLVIPETASQIGQLGHHKVDLKGYDRIVLIEVIRGYLGVGIVENFDVWRKLNLQELCEKGDLPRSAAVEEEVKE